MKIQARKRMVTGPQQQEKEEIEGLGSDEENTWGDYPIDTLLIRTETRTIHDILRRIEKGSFVMNPDFQRDFIWPEDKQSKLIESVLLRIPLPVFYLAEDHDGKMIVVDGLQRLSTFRRFVNNELRLKLPERKDLHNRTFNALPSKLQNRIEDCGLILYVIDAKVPERAKLDIFERVNGGIPLTRQQMRNCLYMGRATKFLKDEAKSNIFKKATGESLNTKTMRDREFINRFCAFSLLSIDTYKGDMDDFLANALQFINKNMTSDSLAALSSGLKLSMTNNLALFGMHAFRKHSDGQTNRNVINASLWDVMSTIFANYPEELVKSRARNVKEAFYGLLGDDDFNEAITYGPNAAKNVRYRFEKAWAVFREVLGDPQNRPELL